jgi:hypothetical protein
MSPDDMLDFATQAALLRIRAMPERPAGNPLFGPNPRRGLVTEAMSQRVAKDNLSMRALALEHVAGNRDAAEALLRNGQPSTRELADGSVGHYTRPNRADDCFAAALATCLQVPLDEVPDPNIDVRLAAGDSPDVIEADTWDTLEWWLGKRGLRLVAHCSPAFELNRWIGVVQHPQRFQSHRIVMRCREVLFDPVNSALYERPVRQYHAGDITSGVSFESTSQEA